MNVESLNKKRKLIVTLSIIITIILLIIFIFGELLFINYSTGIFKISMMGFLIILFLAALYLFSKFVIMPMHNKLKLIIIEKIFNDKFSPCSLKLCKPNKEIEYLYNKNNLTISNSITLEYKGESICFYDFKYTTKSGLKKANDIFKGKYISIPIKPLKMPCSVFIMQGKKKSEDFNVFFEKKYSNVNKELSVGKKYLRYNTYYNEKVDYKIVQILDEIKDFACLIIDDNNLKIYFHENVNEFDFRLKDKLTNNIYFYCKDSYVTLLNLLNKINMMKGNKNG